MSESNPFVKKIKESVGIRLAVLFWSFFVLLIISSGIGSLANNLPIDERSKDLFSSAVQCVLAFILPAIILARFSSKDWSSWLELSRMPKLKALAGVFLVYVISMPAMEWLIEWNQSIHFPDSLSRMEQYFRELEEKNEAIYKVILDANGFGSVLAGVLIIGLLTGFSEELFFRGGLQGILSRSHIGNGTAVWFSAIVFSTMHFQFFGFFPRLLMGVFFGYLLIWTKNIWVPVFAHALNNSVVVISSALMGHPAEGMWDTSETSLYFGHTWAMVCSVILTALFLIVCRDNMFKTKEIHYNKWQKNQLPPVSES